MLHCKFEVLIRIKKKKKTMKTKLLSPHRIPLLQDNILSQYWHPVHYNVLYILKTQQRK